MATVIGYTDILGNSKMEMSKQQIKAMVIMNIIDNCTMELDNTGQERYSLNEQQFGKCVDTLVKNINTIQCCKSDSEQLKCSGCKKPLHDGLCGRCCSDLANGMY